MTTEICHIESAVRAGVDVGPRAQAARSHRTHLALAPFLLGLVGLLAAANVVAEHLRGLSFAQEAADLLRSGPVPPTGDQLVQDDRTSRIQLTHLAAAIAGLRTQVDPAGESPQAG